MGDKLRVLVTDDEEGMRHGVERALRRFVSRFPDLDAEITYEIELASTGEEAVERLSAQDVDLLLLDYKLPGINGLDVLTKVQELKLKTLTVMMTAYASLDTAVSATKKGAFDFLAKPFTPEELRATVRKATRHLIVDRQAQKLAEEKRQVRFQFISVLSHELKAPLGAVEGYLNLIADGNSIKDEKTLQHVVNRSLIRIQGMRKLIFDLLDLTRIESGSKKREMGEVDLVEIAQSSIEMMNNDAAARSITIQLSAPEFVKIVGDRNELEIIFNNLVSNAVKYNRDNGSVNVNIEQENSEVKIHVSDTGIGMTKDECKKLFGEFVRIKNAKTRNIEGSGLGLSTLKKIAHLYNGDVKVTSEPDEGSTFSVIIKSSEG